MIRNGSLLIFAAIGAVLVNLSLFILPFCGGTTMPCHKTSLIEAILGAVILVLGVALIFIKDIRLLLATLFSISVVGIFVALVPTVIVGVCKHPHMGCHAVSLPVLLIFGIVITFSSLGSGLFLYRRYTRERS